MWPPTSILQRWIREGALGAGCAWRRHPAQRAAAGSLGPRFDLVVANILEEPLRQLASALSNALAPGGALLLSGFTRPQTPALRVLYERAGLAFVSETTAKSGRC